MLQHPSQWTWSGAKGASGSASGAEMQLSATNTFSVLSWVSHCFPEAQEQHGRWCGHYRKESWGCRENQPPRDGANWSTLLIYPRDYSALSISGMECQRYFFSSNMLEVSKPISIENTWPWFLNLGNNPSLKLSVEVREPIMFGYCDVYFA